MMRERLLARGSRVGSCVCPTGVAAAMFGVLFGLVSCQTSGPLPGGGGRASSTSAPTPEIAEPNGARAAEVDASPIGAERGFVPSETIAAPGESIESEGDATAAALARASELDSASADAQPAPDAIRKGGLESPADGTADRADAVARSLAPAAGSASEMRAMATATAAVDSVETSVANRAEDAASVAIEKARAPVAEDLDSASGSASSKTDDDIVVGFEATPERRATVTAESATSSESQAVPVADGAGEAQGSLAASGRELVDDIVALLSNRDDAGDAAAEATASEPASSAAPVEPSARGSASAPKAREVGSSAQAGSLAAASIAARAAGSAAEEGAGIVASSGDASGASSKALPAGATSVLDEAGIAPAVAASTSPVGRAPIGSSATETETETASGGIAASGSSLRAEAESLVSGGEPSASSMDPVSLMPAEKAGDPSPLRWLWWVAAAAVFAGIVYLGQRSRRSDALADDRF